MAERERKRREEIEGVKGGSAEAYAGHMYYEPTVTAVTDMIVPATRIQWGPVFAGLLVSLSVMFLLTALGVGLNLGLAGLGYWIIGSGVVGLFLGSYMAARTAKASLIPAILHAVITWALVMMLNVFAFGGIGSGLLATMRTTPGATPTVPTAAINNAGWLFFIGFLILLAASVIGGAVGAYPREQVEEPVEERR